MLVQRFSVALCFVLLSGCSSETKEVPKPDKTKQLLIEAEEAASWHLKDPESARYQWFNVFPDAKVACGLVNAKNGFGGYAGKKGVAYADGAASLEGEGGDYIAKVNRCSDLTEKHIAEKDREIERDNARTQQILTELRKLDPKAAEKLEKELSAR